MARKIMFILTYCLITLSGKTQDNSLLQMIDDSISHNMSKNFTTATFKATQIVNMQTVESVAAGALSFIIQHRFGQLNSGAYNLFGLDNATLRLGLDYGITDRLTVGVGRSSFEKTFDSYLKYKIIRQSDGHNAMPITVSVSAAINYFTLNYPDKPYLNATYRTSYIGQLLIARKFSNALSLQITPTYLHYNLVPTVNDKNDEFAIAAGGRLKFTKRMSISAEYNYLLPNQISSIPVYNSFSLGWEIETGGHVFQLVFSNSQGIAASQYIGRTTSGWADGGIYFGFNISRNFTIVNHTKHSLIKH